MSFWCRRGAISRNSRFSCQIRFWIDFLMILGGFGSHFGSQNGAKMDSKIDQKIDGFLDRSWKRSGPPKVARAGLAREGRGPRRVPPLGRVETLGSPLRAGRNPRWCHFRGLCSKIGLKIGSKKMCFLKGPFSFSGSLWASFFVPFSCPKSHPNFHSIF